MCITDLGSRGFVSSLNPCTELWIFSRRKSVQLLWPHYSQFYLNREFMLGDFEIATTLKRWANGWSAENHNIQGDKGYHASVTSCGAVFLPNDIKMNSQCDSCFVYCCRPFIFLRKLRKGTFDLTFAVLGVCFLTENSTINTDWKSLTCVIYEVKVVLRPNDLNPNYCFTSESVAGTITGTP